MLTVALISQKGGVGKTTLAIHLATAFETAGRQTLLVDLDPQTSAAEWKDARQAERPYVMAVPPSRLGKTLVSSDIQIYEIRRHPDLRVRSGIEMSAEAGAGARTARVCARPRWPFVRHQALDCFKASSRSRSR